MLRKDVIYMYCFRCIVTNVYTVSSSISSWKVKYERERDKTPALLTSMDVGLVDCDFVWQVDGLGILTLNGLYLDYR